ncbi:hypothetical protein ABZ690_14545 [Streptomyces sp. NPDC006967]|uniref:hypothetical protein n=1 Tax=unclassified Streptomyces TaxID=2593676 RepID=UPI0033DD03FF
MPTSPRHRRSRYNERRQVVAQTDPLGGAVLAGGCHARRPDPAGKVHDRPSRLLVTQCPFTVRTTPHWAEEQTCARRVRVGLCL